MKQAKNKKQKINKKMSFDEIMQKEPEAKGIFLERGMHCIGCPMAQQESLEQGALAHGINPDELVEEVNKKLKKKKEKK